jgi:TolB protein
LEIFVMNADGRAVLRLTTNRQHDLEPSWSPTGGRLAFTSERDGNSEIYVMDADGTGQRNITKNRAHDSRPAWRPSAERA